VKQIGKWFSVFLLIVVLPGCGCQAERPLVAVVEKIEVIGSYQGEALLRTYTESQKIAAVLNYLRWLRPQFKADCDPEMIPGDEYTITVSLSDGVQEVYRQKTNGYLRKDNGRWENIDPEKGVMLYEIISQMDSDGQV